MKFHEFLAVMVLSTMFWKFTIIIIIMIALIFGIYHLMQPKIKCLHEYRIIKDPETRVPYLICKKCGEEDKV